MSVIRIFTSLYPEQNERRRNEIEECLKRNLAAPAIDAVCLLLEGTDPPLVNESKLVTRQIQERPSYSVFFDWANEHIESDTDISVVTNSDIHFDSSLTALADSLQPGQCAALSRWDVQKNGAARLFDRADSQDAWVFRGRIRPVVSDFLVGVPRCDNRILHELRKAGYDVINPSFSVRVFHLHDGERTEYPDVIEGPHVDPPYAYIWPHNLYSLPGTLLHRLRRPGTPLGWRPDWRRVQRTLPWRACRKLCSVFSRKKEEI